MEATIEYIRQMIALLNQAQDEYNLYSKQLSLLDLEAQDILHRLEYSSFNVVQG